MEIRLGAPVYFSTGERGSVIGRAIVDPDRWEVNHIVVEPSGEVPARKLVPIDEVARASADRVDLRLDRDGLRAMADYVEQRYVTPRQFLAPARPPQPGDQVPSKYVLSQPSGPGPQPPPSAPIELRGGAVVQAVDGAVGRLIAVYLAEPTNRITLLGIRDDLAGRDVRVPSDWVAYVDPTLIRLATERGEVVKLFGAPAGDYLAEEPGSAERQPR